MKSRSALLLHGADIDTRRRMLLQAAVLSALGVGTQVSASTAARRQVALVVGNSHYAGTTLKHAGNDARQIRDAVSDLGFGVVTLLDATRKQMLEELATWITSSSEASTRLFYYAGHGAQYRGRNFLIPVDAQLKSEDDLPAFAIDVNDLVDRLSRTSRGVNLVILDACRSSPLAAPRARPGTRGGSAPGLLALDAPKGTLIAFSTAPGALADDNSLYTTHLVANLREPGLPIEAVFKRTRSAVERESRGQQMPWESSSLTGEFCLVAGPGGTCGGRGQ